MKVVKYLLLAVVFLVVGLYGVLFNLSNGQEVVLVFPKLLEMGEQPIAVWVISAFAIGGILGMLCSSGLYLLTRRKLSKAKKSLERSEKELSQLNTSSAKV